MVVVECTQRFSNITDRRPVLAWHGSAIGGFLLGHPVDELSTVGKVLDGIDDGAPVETTGERHAAATEERLGNVAVVLSSADSTRLPPAAATHAFVCDAYHHFVDWPAMLASIHQALVPGGTLVVVDFDRVPGKSPEWLLTHVRAGKETVREEIEEAGFEFLDEPEIEGFEENYLLRFRRP